MKDRRRRNAVSLGSFFWRSLFIVFFFCLLIAGFTFSTLRLFRETFRPVVVVSKRIFPAVDQVVSRESPPAAPATTVRETVLFPDQALVFLEHYSSSASDAAPTKDDLHCFYFSTNASSMKLPPVGVDEDGRHLIVRCPLPTPKTSTTTTTSVTVALKSGGSLQLGPTYSWNTLAYEALVDRDNTTIVFVKGLRLRPERVSDPARFECLYGWDFTQPRLLLRSAVHSLAQEIVRCMTPMSVLRGGGPHRHDDEAPNPSSPSVMVSVRVKGGGTIPTVARLRPRSEPGPTLPKSHQMCVCTMIRNQARFLREWVMYHARIGVQRWFIYDNNSDDDIDTVIRWLTTRLNLNITRHLWPWIKTQEAGFAHCALRARPACTWVGFIDVDEFFHLHAGLHILDVLRNYSDGGQLSFVGDDDHSGVIGGDDDLKRSVGELRTPCYSFGPSGLKEAPREGVTVGYTCRVAAPERHKSIVRPEALNASLINVVHHFHLMDKFTSVDLNPITVMAVNHYKYQVWDVFKEKFYRRVATYVTDWQQNENVGSKDRAPGLGTEPIEPPDWSTRFCEVRDTSLKDRVLGTMANPITGLLPWQEEEEEEVKQDVPKRRRKRENIGIINDEIVTH